MKSNKLQVLSIILFAAVLVVTLVFYRNLPERIPIHWTTGGVPDRFASRFSGAFSLLIAVVLIFALWTLLSKLISKGRTYLNVFFFILTLVPIIIQTLSLFWNLRHKFDISYYGGVVGSIAIGILFIYLGLFLKTTKGKIHAGVHFGLWKFSTKALSDDEVRKKTNNIAGSLFIILGLLSILLSFFPKLQNLSLNIVLWGTISVVVFTYAYSSFMYKKVSKSEKL